MSEAVFSWTPAVSGYADLRLVGGTSSSLAIGTDCSSYPACTTDLNFSGHVELLYPVTAGTPYVIFVAYPAYQTVSASLTILLEP
jgi:hypothetical protein